MHEISNKRGFSVLKDQCSGLMATEKLLIRKIVQKFDIFITYYGDIIYYIIA